MSVGEASVLQNLEKDVEHVRVSLFDFVEQDHLEWSPPHRLGELTALVVTHVAGGRSDQAGDRVLLHVLRHINAHQVLFMVEQELGERTRQFRLADSRGAEEDEAANWTFRVLEPGPGAPHRLGDGPYRLLLADDPLMEPLFHAQQLLRLLLQHPAHWDARPLGNQPANVLLVHHHVYLVVLEPAITVGVEFGLQSNALRPQLHRLRVVGHLGGSLLLVLEPVNVLLLLFEIPRHALGFNPQLAGRLVNEVNGLVRQVAVGDVAMAQLDGGLQRRLLNLDLVMGLVAGAERPQHLNGGIQVRLLNEDRLEPALQGGVLLDVLAVLVDGGRSYALEFPAGQRRLQKVAGVQATLRRSRPDDCVYLVDEQDYLAASLFDLVDYAFQTLLELPPELASGHQVAHVQRKKPAVLQHLRDISGNDALRKPLRYGGLADTGVADDGRVVLCPAGEGLHHPLHLDVSANDGVQFAVPRQSR